MALNGRLDEMHRYLQHVEANTAQLNGSLKVHVENEPLSVQMDR